MAALTHVLCLVLLAGLAYGRALPSAQSDDDSNMLSIFREMNRIMAAMHERFHRLFNSSPIANDDRKQLDAIQPNCTTTTNITETITCTKELIANGKKQTYKEVNVTGGNGVLISRSKIYRTTLVN